MRSATNSPLGKLANRIIRKFIILDLWFFTRNSSSGSSTIIYLFSQLFPKKKPPSTSILGKFPSIFRRECCVLLGDQQIYSGRVHTATRILEYTPTLKRPCKHEAKATRTLGYAASSHCLRTTTRTWRARTRMDEFHPADKKVKALVDTLHKTPSPDITSTVCYDRQMKIVDDNELTGEKYDFVCSGVGIGAFEQLRRCERRDCARPEPGASRRRRPLSKDRFCPWRRRKSS